MKKLNFSSLRYFLIGLMLSGICAVSPAYASEDKGHEEEEFNAAEMILHHVLDDYSFHFADWKDAEGKEHVLELPLPIILITDGNLDVFMSSEFHHGHSTVKRGDREYKLSHGHIEELSGKHPLDFSLTKNATSLFISMVLLLIVFNAVGKGYKTRKGQSPKGIQSFFEPIIIFIRDEVAKPTIGPKYEKFLPYILCVFFFIWFNNVLGLFPGAANASGNIAFTMTLAAFTFILTTVNGNKDYWKHIFATPGVPKPLLVIMMPVEILGMFTKPIALMLRLFANITAGHISILSFITLSFILKSAAIGAAAGLLIVPLYFLELFVAILQAYIFSILSGLFIGMAVADHDHH